MRKKEEKPLEHVINALESHPMAQALRIAQRIIAVTTLGLITLFISNETGAGYAG